MGPIVRDLADLSAEEREHLKFVEQEAVRVLTKIQDRMRVTREGNDKAVRYTQGAADSGREAVELLLIQMYAISMVHRKERKKLEARIAALEELVTRP
ncbi:hypothetical protein [Tardiphaga sp. 285_C5_N1_2]|uniref:hypothetical protein n=1 Tax=Tardiphaga sp. 285_C5_N1_2 TaxID=3240775 RepID=UPI003F8B36B9